MFYLHLPVTLETVSWGLLRAIGSEQAVNPNDFPVMFEFDGKQDKT